MSFEPPSHLPSCELEKAWSTLWYLLDPVARGPGPERKPSTVAGQAVMGAHVFGRAFCEGKRYPQYLSGLWGHPRFLCSPEVEAAAGALGAVTAESLFDVYDAERMGRVVYALKPRDLTWSRFEELRAFYRAAARRGDAVVVHVW